LLHSTSGPGGEAQDANFPEAKFISATGGQDIDALVKRLDKIDLILASPTCTNHSPAKGNKPRCEQSKETAFKSWRFAKRSCPRWVVHRERGNMRKWTRYAEFKVPRWKSLATNYGTDFEFRQLLAWRQSAAGCF